MFSFVGYGAPCSLMVLPQRSYGNCRQYCVLSHAVGNAVKGVFDGRVFMDNANGMLAFRSVRRYASIKGEQLKSP